jgi:hypothetical protein
MLSKYSSQVAIVLGQYHNQADQAEMDEALITTSVFGFRFLTKVGFRTKKSIRGHANDWQEILCMALKHSRRARTQFVYSFLFTPSFKRKGV